MSQDISNTISGKADRPYRFESSVWGQSLDIFVQRDMLLLTASDFDSGQTVRIGINADLIDGIIVALRAAVQDATEREVVREKQQDEAKAAYKKALKEDK